MNRNKMFSIFTALVLTITMIVPASGVNGATGGDGSGSADWPLNLGISYSLLEKSDYKLGTSTEFEIAYYPSSNQGGIKATRHIEINGPEVATDIQYSEQKQTASDRTWSDISSFSKEVTITESKTEYIKATFNAEGTYKIRFWLENGETSVETTRTIYVSDSGIFRLPTKPNNMRESLNKKKIQWSVSQAPSFVSVSYNFYVDGQLINKEPIVASASGNLEIYKSEFEDLLTPGSHIFQVEEVYTRGKVSVKSEKESMEYAIEEPTTEAPTTTEESTEAPTTTEESTEAPTTTEESTEAPTTTEKPTEAPTTTEESTEAATTTEESTEAPTTTEESTETPTTTEAPTTAQETTTPTICPTVKKISLAKGKITKAEKKKKAKKLRITFARIKNATSYQVQISTSKKFSKKTTITRKTKKTKYTFKKLKKNKKYFVRVRGVAIVKKKCYYGKWSNKKRVKLKK